MNKEFEDNARNWYLDRKLTIEITPDFVDHLLREMIWKQPFGGCSTRYPNYIKESNYRKVKKEADKINHTIPTIEDLAKQYKVDVDYDCKSPFLWDIRDDNTVVIRGWSAAWSDEDFFTKRISNIEFLSQSKLCDADYTRYLDHIDKSEARRKVYSLVQDIEEGAEFTILSGPYYMSIATMIEKQKQDCTVRLEDGSLVQIYNKNLASKKIIKRLKVEDLNWQWCFHCEGATAICPDCGSNSCGAGCRQQLDLSYSNTMCEHTAFWDIVQAAEERNLNPHMPTEEEVQKYFSFAKENIKKHNSVNYGLEGYRESKHYELTRTAKMIDVKLPTYRDLCEELGVDGDFDCKTTQQYIDDDHREYIVPNIEQYDQDERISWIEFLRRIERKKK